MSAIDSFESFAQLVMDRLKPLGYNVDVEDDLELPLPYVIVEQGDQVSFNYKSPLCYLLGQLRLVCERKDTEPFVRTIGKHHAAIYNALGGADGGMWDAYDYTDPDNPVKVGRFTYVLKDWSANTSTDRLVSSTFLTVELITNS